MAHKHLFASSPKAQKPDTMNEAGGFGVVAMALSLSPVAARFLILGV